MVRRILALLLIGAWQLQAAVPPHVHAGMSAEELIAHGEHRHVHLAHDSHEAHDHGHSHRQTMPAEGQLAYDLASPPAEHDESALYLDAESEANVTRTSPYVVPQGATNLASARDRTSSHEQHTSAPPRYGGQLPAFLGITRLLL